MPVVTVPVGQQDIAVQHMRPQPRKFGTHAPGWGRAHAGLLGVALLGCQLTARPTATPTVAGPGEGIRTLATRPAAGATHAPAHRPGDGLKTAEGGAGTAYAGVDGGILLGTSVKEQQQAPARFAGPVPQGRGDPQRSGRTGYRISKLVPSEVWRVCTGGTIAATPTIASDGTVLFSSHDKHVYAVAPDGALRWRHRTGDMVWSAAALVGPAAVNPAPSGPATGGSDPLALVGSDDDKLYALRITDGTVAWTLSPGACRWPTGRSPEAARCDIEDVTLARDGTAYFGGEAIYAAKPDGKLLWSFSPEHPPEKKPHCSSAPAIAPDGSVRAVCQDALYALNPDGSKRWRFEGAGEFDSAPAVGSDGTAYVGDDARRLVAIDPAGQVRFSFTSGGPVRSAPALRADGTVIFGAFDGVLYALRPDGTLAWSFTTADSIQSSPLVDADGAVLFGSRDNRLYALSPDGSLRWSVVLEEDIDGTPTLGPDGTIYVGSDDRCLHAFR